MRNIVIPSVSRCLYAFLDASRKAYGPRLWRRALVGAKRAWRLNARRSENFQTGVLLDRSGNIAVTFALMAVPLMLLAGGAVDVGRAYYVKNELSNALDTATLAVASSNDTSQTTLNNILSTTFSANYSLAAMAPLSVAPAMTISGNLVTSSASVTLSTTFLSLITPSLTIGAESTVSKETSGVEIVLALDTTGSMADDNPSKMTELKAAATSVINTLFNNQSTSTSVLISIVPFTDTVNVGPKSTSIVSPLPSTYNWGTTSWAGCVMAPLKSGTSLASNEDQLDDFDVSAGIWRPYYWPSSSNNLWMTTVNTPSGCGSGKGKTKCTGTTTAYNISSNYANSSGSTGPNAGCEPNIIVPMTNQTAPLFAAINAFTPYGNTHIGVGMAWAWYAFATDFPGTAVTAATDKAYKKYIILMTDGENTIQSFSAYGNLSDGELGTTDNTTAVNALNNRLATVCTNIQNAGITIYTVALEVTSTVAQSLLTNCASPPNRYYPATSSTLQSVFSSIAGEISRVKLVK